MSLELPLPELAWAVEAAQSKKASTLTLLDLRELGSFTDFFLLCSGFSGPQIQAIADGIEQELARRGVELTHREGFHSSEWVLLDYGNFIIHIFSEKARLFYDLERLWRAARRTDIPEPGAAPTAGAPSP